MQDKSSMLLRILLNRYHGGQLEALLKGLPDDEAQKVRNWPIDSGDIRATLERPQEVIKSIHYSWLLPQIQDLPQTQLSLMLSVLPKPHASKLRSLLPNAPQPLTLSGPMKTFLSGQLYKDLSFNEVMPVAYLPSTEMTQVANLTKRSLVKLIDFLALYDLAQEVHHIVSKKIIENIYTCLTPKKQAFLKHALHSKEKLVTQRLQLEHWDGDCQKLIKLLHHRGMVRLGYALSGQHPDLQWHITHILDHGRGKKLSCYFHKEEIPGVTKFLKKQVLTVINFLKERVKQ